MRQAFGWLLVGLLAVTAGCASGGATTANTCASCKFAVPDKKVDPPKIYCVVDGKQIDCRVNPSACPGCKK